MEDVSSADAHRRDVGGAKVFGDFRKSLRGLAEIFSTALVSAPSRSCDFHQHLRSTHFERRCIFRFLEARYCPTCRFPVDEACSTRKQSGWCPSRSGNPTRSGQLRHAVRREIAHGMRNITRRHLITTPAIALRKKKTGNGSILVGALRVSTPAVQYSNRASKTTP